MKKFRLFLSMVLMALLPMSVLADCFFIPNVLPGQDIFRSSYNITATVEVGTIVEVKSSITNYTSTDPEVIIAYKGGGKTYFAAIAPGTATVSYTEQSFDGNGNACETEHSVEYTVAMGTPQVSFQVGNAGGITEYDYDMGDNLMRINAGIYLPTAYMQNGVLKIERKQVPEDQLMYRTTNPDVARIDADGYLEIVGGGTAVVTASWWGNSIWKPVEAQMVVNVDANPLHLKVAGIKVTKDNCKDILGDGKKQAVYDPEEHILTLKEVNWDFSDHSIDAKYGVIEYWDTEEDLYIEIDGKCTFTNTTIGINTEIHNGRSNTENVGLDITGINHGALIMSGEMAQIKCAQGVSVENIQLVASSKGSGVKTFDCPGFGVYDGSNVVVSSKGNGGLPMRPKWLYMTENVMLGEGLNYISYETSKSLYGIYDATLQLASVVSFLSQEVMSYGEPDIPSSDSETTINLGGDSSEDTEKDALIVLGEDDKYNDEKKQLELSTILTDQEVKDALELFGPDAEVLKYLLPGTISFYIPAGKGSIKIECQTFFGQLKLMLNGSPSVALTQEVMGWVDVDYNVEVDTYVVVYLGTMPVPVPSPARISAIRLDGEPDAGMYIKNIKIVPSNTPTGIESQELKANSQKLIKDGQLIILRGEKTYTVTGQEIK